jgi:hypothetical protein
MVCLIAFLLLPMGNWLKIVVAEGKKIHSQMEFSKTFKVAKFPIVL